MPDRPRGIVQWAVAVVVLGPILAAAALADLLRRPPSHKAPWLLQANGHSAGISSTMDRRRPHELPSGAIRWEGQSDG